MGGGSDSAKSAAKAQTAALQQQIAEQRAAYGDAQNLLQPYQQAGLGGLQSYLALLGQSGDQAQQDAISGLEQTPGYQSQLQAGQRSLLQNASATGGLRGGNVQSNLAEFGSGLFGNYYQNLLGQMGNLQNQGLQTNTGLANLRQGNAAQVGNTYANMGEAQGQGILAQQAAKQQQASNIGSMIGTVGGAIYGGPAGASVGSQAGGAFGSLLGGK